jgi:peptidoglycan/xylan/chitin deacetylase (PgdA/CDA1 family)
MTTDLTGRATIPPVNTDRPTPAPQDSTSADAAEIEESAEPTVAFSQPGDSGGGEPTVTLSAAEVSERTADSASSAGSEPTADPSAATPAADTVSDSAGSEPTADLSAVPPAADTVSDRNESEPTVTLSAAETTDPRVTPRAAEVADEAVSPSMADTADETVALPTTSDVGDETAALPAGGAADATIALTTGDAADNTIALTTNDAADETAALPPHDDADETIALTAGEVAAAVAAASAVDESEPTTVIPAGSEPTVALPKPRLSPESKVAVPIRRESPPTPGPANARLIQAAPTPPPTPESTVALPPVPAPRSAPTVGRPPADPTIALPVAPNVARPPADSTIALPVAPRPRTVVPPPAKPLTRRRLLWGVSGVAGTALIGGTIAALTGRGEPEAAKNPNLVVSEPAPARSLTPTPRPTTPVMKFPVHTLQDFRRMVPGDPFPTDAIALTIDDGPHPVWTPQILRLLEKHDVPALFCMIGNQVLGHEATARDVAADGHQIANHTWSHPIDLAQLPAQKMIKEIHRAQDKIYSTTGYAPSLFRAPGGGWSKGLSESVSKSGVIPMDWTTDPRDWSRPGVAQITERLLAAEPGQILLCHDGGGDRSQTLASLQTVIPALQAKGLKFVALR